MVRVSWFIDVLSQLTLRLSCTDDVWDEDSAYVEMLANEGQRLREKSARAALGEDVSDDEEEDDIEEELGYISPLDTVDPYVSFKQALTGKRLSSGSWFAYPDASYSLPDEERQWLPACDDIPQPRSADLPDGGDAHRRRARRCLCIVDLFCSYSLAAAVLTPPAPAWFCCY